MPDLVRRWTREEVLALPDDGNRYELFDGALLVTPAPSGLHQVALTRLYGRAELLHGGDGPPAAGRRQRGRGVALRTA